MREIKAARDRVRSEDQPIQSRKKTDAGSHGDYQIKDTKCVPGQAQPYRAGIRTLESVGCWDGGETDQHIAPACR